jgi:hypothetical protein
MRERENERDVGQVRSTYACAQTTLIKQTDKNKCLEVLVSAQTIFRSQSSAAIGLLPLFTVVGCR